MSEEKNKLVCTCGAKNYEHTDECWENAGKQFFGTGNQMQQLNTFDPNEHKPKGQIKEPHSLDPITIRPVLTKREWFAGMALSGLCANPASFTATDPKRADQQFAAVIKASVMASDALIAALNQPVK